MNSFQTNVNTSEVLVDLALMINDKRRGRVWLPYPVAFALFLAMAEASNYVKDWSWWQRVTNWVAPSLSYSEPSLCKSRRDQ